MAPPAYLSGIRLRFAHKDGRLAYEAAMRGPGHCPYCGHRQDRHVAGNLGKEIEVQCDDCDLIYPRLRIIVPAQ